MPYYKIPKENLHFFTKEYQESSIYTPNTPLSKKEFDALWAFYSNIYKEKRGWEHFQNTFKEKVNFLGNSFPKLLTSIRSLLKEDIPQQDKATILSIFHKYSIPLVEPARRLFESEKNYHPNPRDALTLFLIHKDFTAEHNNHISSSDFLYPLLGSLLDSEEKWVHFQEINSLVVANKQRHIIDINFGNAEHVPVQPIKNIDGILQNYVLNLIDAEDVFIHSPSEKDIIIESVNLQTPLVEATPQEYEAFFNTGEFFLKFKDVLDIQNFILENKSQNKTEDVPLSAIEQKILNFNEITNKYEPQDVPAIQIDTYFELLEEAFKTNKHQDLSSVSLIEKQMHATFENPLSNIPLVKRIRQIFDNIYQAEKLLDPTISPNLDADFLSITQINRNILQKIASSIVYLKNTARENLTPHLNSNFKDVELFYLFGSASLEGNYRQQSEDKVSVHHGWKPKLSSTEKMTFYPYDFSKVSDFIEKIQQQDKSSWDDLNSSKLFIFLKQEFYPYLPLKMKLMPEHYENILNTNYNRNTRLLNKALPLSLLLDDAIFKKYQEKFKNYSFNISYNDNYIAEVCSHRVLNFIEKFKETPTPIEDNSFSTNKITLSQVAHFLLTNTSAEEEKDSSRNYFKFILEYHKFLEKNNLPFSNYALNLLDIPEHVEINLNKDDSLELYSIYQKYSKEKNSIVKRIVDNIIQDPEFNPSKDMTPLEFYKKYNDCFNENSNTATINYFRKHFKSIVQHHIKTSTVSTNDFILPSFINKDFFTKPVLNDFHKMDHTVLLAFPSLIKILQPEKFIDPQVILDTTLQIFKNVENSKLNNHSRILDTYLYHLPKELSNNFELFTKVLDEYILTPNNFTTKNSFSNSVTPHFALINKFNPSFFNYEKTIVSGLKFADQYLMDAFSDVKNPFLSKLTTANPEYSHFLQEVLSKRLKPMELIDGIANIQMTRNIFINQTSVNPHVGVKQFKF